jgi:hypothetical protein
MIIEDIAVSPLDNGSGKNIQEKEVAGWRGCHGA